MAQHSANVSGSERPAGIRKTTSTGTTVKTRGCAMWQSFYQRSIWVGGGPTINSGQGGGASTWQCQRRQKPERVLNGGGRIRKQIREKKPAEDVQPESRVRIAVQTGNETYDLEEGREGGLKKEESSYTPR